MRRCRWSVVVVGCVVCGSVMADPALEGRVARLERILSTEGPSQILLRVQQLQQEVQDLRGLVESQQHRLDRLERRLPSGDDSGATAGPSGIDDGDWRSPRSDEQLRQWGQQPETAGWVDGLGEGFVRGPAGGGLSLPSPETATGGERDAYLAAFDLLKDRQYEDAIGAFDDLIERFPQGEYAEDSLFWLGETYFVTRDYDAAMTQYDRLIAAYPQSERLPSAMLKVGYIHEEQGHLESARAVLEEVTARYPFSNEAGLARDRLKRMEGRESR